MRKSLYSLLVLALCVVNSFFVACGKNDDVQITPVPQNDNATIIEGGTQKTGELPAAEVTGKSLGIMVSGNSSALAGGGNIITINSPVKLKTFYVKVSNMDGYTEVPAIQKNDATRATSDENYEYELNLSYGTGLSENITINVNAETDEGKVASILTQEITFVESDEGDLRINLTFDQLKDVDLHLVMPDSTEIYFGNRSYANVDSIFYANIEQQIQQKVQELKQQYNLEVDEYGNVIYPENYDEDYGNRAQEYYLALEEFYGQLYKQSYAEGNGLDHDSNAGCSIDSLNNENIVLKADYLIPGTYRVYVNMFSNCYPLENRTKYNVITRLGSTQIPITQGKNPYFGEFEIEEESNGYLIREQMVHVMTFELTQAQIDALKQQTRGIAHEQKYFMLAPCSDMSVMKLLDSGSWKKTSRRFFLKR